MQHIKSSVRQSVYLLLALLFLIFDCSESGAQGLPIKPARTISFTTSKGSYIDLDVSPDGKKIVFSLLGDLYTIPASGGVATQLTRGMAINGWPAWSPDGKKIACLSDCSGDFHWTVRDLKGQILSVIHVGNEGTYDDKLRQNPIWTSDSRALNINKDSLYNIYGGNLPLPVKAGKISNQVSMLRFSAAGEVYYSERSRQHDSLFRYNSKTGEKSFVVVLDTLEKFGGYSAVLSPDARWVCYFAEDNKTCRLELINVAAKIRRILVPSLFADPIKNYHQVKIRYGFSPDSKYIFIGYGGKIHRIDVASGRNTIIPFTARVTVDMGALVYNKFRVTRQPLTVRYTRSANASPDGKQLIFMALNHLYTMDLPKGRPHMLAPQPINQYQPCWSPDGKWIAYVSWSDTAGGQLWRVPATGGKPEQLTKVPGQYQRPVWSPDGKYLAVVKGGAGDYKINALWAKGEGPPSLGDRDDAGMGQLQLVSIDNGTIRMIADSVPLWNQLAFSKDGNRIIYHTKNKRASRAFTNYAVSQSLADTDKQVVAIARFGDNAPAFLQQAAFSSDGRFVVYSLGEDLFIVPSAAATPTILLDAESNCSAIRFATGVDPNWESGGKVLNWSYGNHFYRLDPDKIMAAAAKVEIPAGAHFKKVNIQPDQAIPLTVTVPQSYAHGRIALENVRIITMKGEQVIPNGAILITNGRFEAVGPAGTVAIPKDAKVIDLEGKTVMPGFVDLHLHMRVPPDIFPQQSWMFLVNLAYGVTTARDPSQSYDSFGYAELLETGQMIGPRLFSSGRPVRLFIEGIQPLTSLADVENIVEKRKTMGGLFMKQYLLPTRLQREWLLLASKQLGLNMTNEGFDSPFLQIGQLKDGSSGIEHNPTWGDAYDDILELYAKSGTYFTPTLQVRPEGGKEYLDAQYWNQPPAKFTRFTPDEQLKQIMNPRRKYSDTDLLVASRIDARIRKLGGKVTLGSHGNDEGIGVHNEIWALKMGGLTNMQALQAATIMGAEALGIQQDVGSIEPGKIADLIILNENPLEDIHNSREIKYVMKDGILYDGDTLDEIWPVRQKCPEWRLNKSILIDKNEEVPQN